MHCALQDAYDSGIAHGSYGLVTARRLRKQQRSQPCRPQRRWTPQSGSVYRSRLRYYLTHQK